MESSQCGNELGMMEESQWGWRVGPEEEWETGLTRGLGAGRACPGSLGQAGPSGDT